MAAVCAGMRDFLTDPVARNVVFLVCAQVIEKNLPGSTTIQYVRMAANAILFGGGVKLGREFVNTPYGPIAGAAVVVTEVFVMLALNELKQPPYIFIAHWLALLFSAEAGAGIHRYLTNRANPIPNVPQFV